MYVFWDETQKLGHEWSERNDHLHTPKELQEPEPGQETARVWHGQSHEEDADAERLVLGRYGVPADTPTP